MIDPKLAEFATIRQLEILEAVEKHGSNKKAAAAMGIDRRSVDRSMLSLKHKAAQSGYSPEHDMTRTVPEGFKVRGVSTYYNAEGKPSGQWVKSASSDADFTVALKDFAAGLAEDLKGLAPLTPRPAVVIQDLMCAYVLGDPHFGMKAWREDAGDDFDLSIAERLTCGAIDRLIASAPAAKVALLLNLGDHFHADNQRNQTNSGHQLDVDGRWTKVQQVGLRAMVYCVKRLLERHETVVFRINRGNHDGHSAYALALMLDCYFNAEPRVEVDLSPANTWYYQFGKVLVGSTHGDTIKGAALMGVMAADKPAEWGQTKHRYWMVGHIHHQDVKEYPGGIVEYFRTLASRDAWHQGQGYRSGRDMRLIVMHREHGEVERHRCDVGML